MPLERETAPTGTSRRPAQAPRRGCAWALLVGIAGASLFALLGYLSNGLSESRAVAQSRSHLEDWFREANPARAPEEACWVEPETLVRRELTPRLSSGPNWRPKSRLERVLFKPGFVYRSDAPPVFQLFRAFRAPERLVRSPRGDIRQVMSTRFPGRRGFIKAAMAAQ